MPTNDFLPFATAGGAPVLSQADWVTATPANGRGPGILPKEYYNKAQRQGNAMAAAIGTFMAAHGQNALDDGDIAGLAAAFAAALGNASLPNHYSLASSSGGALSRSAIFAAGTWQLSLLLIAHFSENGATYNSTATQSAHLNTLTIGASVNLRRSGGSGYGREMIGSRLAVGTLVVPATASLTLSLDAVVLPGGLDCFGSLLQAEQIA